MLLAHLVFPAPDLEIVTPPRSPGSFYWRMVLEINNWDVPGGLVVETRSFLCREHRFDHWLRSEDSGKGTKIPHLTQHRQNTNKTRSGFQLSLYTRVISPLG